MTESSRRKSLMLTLTHQCNLSCVYCYEKYKSSRTMPLQVAKDTIKKHFSESDGYKEIEISFHGGEPFLEFDHLRSICEWVFNQKWQKPYICFTTTNGTLVHGHIQDWLRTHKKRIYASISLDGTPYMHNVNRSNSYDNIDIGFFRDCWPDQSIKMTISHLSLPSLAEGMIYLHKGGFQIQANFAYGVNWADKNNIAILTKELGKLIEYYLKNPQITPCEFLSMPMQQVALKTNLGKKWCGAGTDMTAVDVDGKEYPCHLFLPFASGSEISENAHIDWRNDESLQDENCKDCVISNVCPTCYGINLIKCGTASRRDISLCTLTKVRALACSYLETQLLKKLMVSLHTKDNDRNTLLKIKGIEAIQSGISF